MKIPIKRCRFVLKLEFDCAQCRLFFFFFFFWQQERQRSPCPIGHRTKNKEWWVLREGNKRWVKRRRCSRCSQSNYRSDMTVLTPPTLPSCEAPQQTPPSKKRNQINLRHDNTTQRDTDTNIIPSSPRTAKVAVHQLQRERQSSIITLLNVVFLVFGTTEGCSVLPRAQERKMFPG